MKSVRPNERTTFAGSTGPTEPASASNSVSTTGVAVLPRRRLFDLLDAATTRSLTVVHACAGSGKTLLLSSWVSWTERRNAWITLQPRHDEPTAFWTALSGALVQAVGEPGTTVRSAGEAETVVALGRDLDEPVVLVVDDFQNVRDPRIMRGLERVLRQAPPMLHLVVSSRTTPRIGLARLRVAGELGEIGADDLACTTEEASALLALADQPLAGADEAREVVRWCGGWPAGVRLAALWRSARPRASPVPEGVEEIVEAYVEDELLPGWPAETVRLLTSTAPFERVDDELAGLLVAGSPATDERVRTLARETTLIRATNGVYGQVPLLRDVLLDRLRREPVRFVEVHRIAAHWYAERCQREEAVHSALATGDRVLVAEQVASDGFDRLPTSAQRAVLSAISPHDAAEDPRLATVCAGERLDAGDPDGAEPYLRILDRSERRLDALGMRLQQACLQGRVTDLDLDTASRVFDTAVEDGRPTEVEEFGLRLANAQMWHGDLVTARITAERAMRATGGRGRTGLPERTALLTALDGRLRDSESLLGQAKDTQATDLIRALVEVERGRPDAHRVPDHTDADAVLSAVTALVRARARLAEGEPLGVLEPSRAWEHGPPVLRDLIAADHVQALLVRGDNAAARTAFEAHLDDGDRSPMREVLRALLALAEGEPGTALGIVEPVLAEAVPETRLLDTIGAMLVAGVAHRRLRSDPALGNDLAVRALELAAPDDLVRVFVSGGNPVRALLTPARTTSRRANDHRAHVLRHFEMAAVTRRATAGPRVALTRSEDAVLRYLPSHLTNNEIAVDLCLSVNTVKTHVRTLYRKLGVHNRRDAIAHASRIGLL